MKRIVQSVFLIFFLLMSLSMTAQNINRPKVALVLGGGGAKGAAEIGALKYIEESGVKIDYVVGTSIGAIIGSLYANGYTVDQLRYLITSQNYLEMAAKPRAVEQLLDSLLHVDDNIDFDSLKIPFRCVAATVPTMTEVVLSKGNLVKAVRASAALPGVFKPVYFDGKLLMDGGVKNNLPVDVARAMGADIVIAIDLNQKNYIAAEDIPAKYYKRVKINNFEDLKNGADWLISQPGLAKYKDNKASADVYIHPKLKDYNVMSFRSSQLYDMLKLGEKAGKKALSKLKKIKKLQVGK